MSCMWTEIIYKTVLQQFIVSPQCYIMNYDEPRKHAEPPTVHTVNGQDYVRRPIVHLYKYT